MSQTLMVRFGADTSAAKRAIVELTTTVATSAISMATAVKGQVDSVQSLAGVMQSLPTIARTALAGFVAFEAAKLSIHAVTASIEEAEAQLKKLVEIGAKAQGAGVGTSFLQGWLSQAKSLNTEAGTLEGMLTRAREASTVRQGTGKDAPTSSMTDRLRDQAKAGNIGAGDVQAFQGADTQEARIRVVLDLVQRLMAEGKQLAALDIASTMFGASFEEKLRSGVDMIGRMKQALDGITSGPDGRIIPQSEIDAARAISEKLDEARTIMADALRPLSEDIARYSQQQAMSWAETKVTIAQTVGYLMEVYKWVNAIGDKITAFGNSPFFDKVYDWFKSNGMGGMNGVVDITPAEREAAKNGGSSPLKMTIGAPKGDKTRNFVAPAPRARGGGGGGETDPVDTFINGLEKSTAALKAEIDAYDKSNAEKRVAIELARAEELAKQNGKTLTEQQTQRIREAASATAQYKDKLAELEQQQRQAAEAAKFFGDSLSNAFGDAIFNGSTLQNVLKNLVSQFGRQSLSAIFTGSGPLAGLYGTAAPASDEHAVGGLIGMAKGLLPSLGGGSGALQGPTQSGATLDAATGGGSIIGDFFKSVFGGFRANGGDVRPGRVYRINELGQELFAPGVSGSMIPASRAAAMGAGEGGGAMSYSPTWQVNAPGAGPEIIATVKGLIAAHDAEINRTLPQRVSRAQRRFT